jgi:glycosyltransferase involved in cell wall biosynthesis
MFACYTLLNSELKEKYNWFLVDSTAKLPIRPVYERSLYALRRIGKLLKYLTVNKIDTVLVFTGDGMSFLEKGLMIILAKKAGKKTIIAPRSGFILRDIENAKRRRFIQRVFGHADVVVCQSSFWQNTFEKVAPNRRYEVVHNWIDTNKYKMSRKFNDRSPIQLLFIGWVVKEKGVYELLEAVKKIHQKGYAIRLDIAGHGTDYEQVAHQIKAAHLEAIVELKGWVKHEQKMELLQKADLFILPTHFEGFPNSLIEAMAAGLPVIASDIDPIKSIVIHDKHALLFECGSAEDLATQITRLVTSVEVRERLAQSASELVEAQFSIAQGVKRFQEII